jgi:hypothetical protein
VYGYYGWSPYWAGAYGIAPYYTPVSGVAGAVPPAGAGYAPRETADPAAPPAGGRREVPEGDPDLRSAQEVIGYYIEATDGSIGHVEDILIDSATWAARYLLVDTRNWWPGRMVLISPRWAEEVSWTEGKVHVGVTRDRVKGSPEYDPTSPIDRGYEQRLHDYYDYRPYWGV